jgi:hypothetical protein
VEVMERPKTSANQPEFYLDTFKFQIEENAELGSLVGLMEATDKDSDKLWYNIIGRYIIFGWFSPGTPVSSTNKTNRHDITEILLKVALNTITQTLTVNISFTYLRVKLQWK